MIDDGKLFGRCRCRCGNARIEAAARDVLIERARPLGRVPKIGPQLVSPDRAFRGLFDLDSAHGRDQLRAGDDPGDVGLMRADRHR